MNEDDILKELTLQKWEGPAIILVDLDAFFASVEQLDHPDWRGKPVIVGGDADKHGVVSTCSYEARKYGVRSAMPSSQAKKLCPEAIWTGGNFSRYREMSKQIMDVIGKETPLVQQVSIDEAFADITPTRTNTEHPVSIAARIQENVMRMGVTCSVGLGTTKSVAKIASDMDKPNGLTVVYPGSETSFLQDLPIRKMSGIGSVAEEKLLKSGIKTLGDMGCAKESILQEVFGKNAEMMRSRALGCDVSEIEVDDTVKSISHEITFSEDLKDRDSIESAIGTLLTKVGRRLRKKQVEGRRLSLKVRFDDRTVHTAQTMLPLPTDDDLALVPYAHKLLDKLWRPGIRIRLIGVAVSGFTPNADSQTSLFDVEDFSNETKRITRPVKDPIIKDKTKRQDFLKAADKLKDKYGEDVLIFGSALRNVGNTTGSSSKNPADYK